MFPFLEISTGPSETVKAAEAAEASDHDVDPDSTTTRKEGEINGREDSDESDQSKEDITISDEIKPSVSQRKIAKLISTFSSLNLFTRVRVKARTIFKKNPK